MNTINWTKHKDSSNRTYQQAVHRGLKATVHPVGRDPGTGDRILEVRAFSSDEEYEVIDTVVKMPQGREVAETWLANEAGKSSRIAARQPKPEPEVEEDTDWDPLTDGSEAAQNWVRDVKRHGAQEQMAYWKRCGSDAQVATGAEKLSLLKQEELHLIHVNNQRRDLIELGDEDWVQEHLASVPHTYKTFQ